MMDASRLAIGGFGPPSSSERTLRAWLRREEEAETAELLVSMLASQPVQPLIGEINYFVTAGAKFGRALSNGFATSIASGVHRR
jgi:hypothetical protein